MLNKLYSFFFNKANILRSAISKKEGESPWRVKTFSALNLFAVEMLEDLFKFLILIFKNPYDSFQLFTKQETLPICEYSYTDHRRFQKKVRLFSLAGMSSVISATIIINLILSLVVPGQIPSYAKTVNGPWDDWSLTDLAGDPPAGSAGTLSISPANSSEITGTGTASTLGLKLASYTVTDDGTLSTTGSATGGTFGAGTNSSTTVSGSGAGASVILEAAPSGFYQVSAGYSHSCGLKNDGSVYCWGSNADGRLGDNTTVAKSVPVQVLGVGGTGTLANIIYISAGDYNTCAVSSTGAAYCWGSNSYGQLGDNTVTQRNTPVQVLGVGAVGTLENIVSISTGSMHTCAVSSTGAAYCWGNNPYGQLGDNTVTQRRTPVQVLGVGAVGTLANIVSIRAGGPWGLATGYTCAVSSTGAAYCWGNNDSGQLGDNTTVAKTVPVQVLGVGAVGTLANIVSIGINGEESTGKDHTCAVSSTGAAYCWGNNDSGRLGDNTIVAKTVPVQVLGVGAVGTLENIVSISTGSMYTCAVSSTGAAYCWGNNPYGQLGDNTVTQRRTPVQVLGVGAVGTLANIVSIDSGSRHTCAVSSTGAAYCWGSGISGRLGDNTTVAKSVPVQVLGVGAAGTLNLNPQTYYTPGTFTSAAIDLGRKANFTTLSWTENGQTITMKARSSANADMSGATIWGSCSNITKDANLSTGGCVTDGHQYIQYQATLSTANTAVTPTLDSVTIGYNQYLSSSAVSNLRFNTGYTNVIWTSVSWVRSDSNTASSTIKVKSQAKTAADSTALASATFVGYNNTATNSSTYFDRPNANCSYAAGKFGDTAGDNETKETVTCTINTGDTTYLNPTASSNQWMELKLILESDGAQTPVIDAARATYSVNANPEVCYTLTDATTCNTAVSLVASQSQSSASYGHIALNSYIRDTDTDTGTTSPGQVLIGLEYSDSSGNFSQSSPPSTASYYTSGNFAQNYIITPNGAGITCSDLDPTGTSTSAFRYLCNVNDNHPGNAYQNGVSPNNFASFTIDWNVKQDLTRYSAAQKVRILVNDQEAINPVNVSNPATSGPDGFTIDTANPTGTAIANIPAGTVALTSTDNSTSSYATVDSNAENCNSVTWPAYGNSISAGTNISTSLSGWNFSANESANRRSTACIKLRDQYGNESAAILAVTGPRPQKAGIQDVANVSAGSYKLFVSWEQVANLFQGSNTFSSYNIYRCAATETTSPYSSCLNGTYNLIGSPSPSGDITNNSFTNSLTATEACGAASCDAGSTFKAYCYRIAANDSAGNISNWVTVNANGAQLCGISDGKATAGTGEPGVSDTYPPHITAVPIITKTSTTATISWTNSESAFNGVFYGVGTAYNLEKSSVLNYSANPSFTITGLTPDTDYNVQIKSVDVYGNTAKCDPTSSSSSSISSSGTATVVNLDTALSGDPTASTYCSNRSNLTFRTDFSDTAKPVISKNGSTPVVTSITSNSATINWKTNDSGTSLAENTTDACVAYDSSTASRNYYSQICGSTTLATTHSVALSNLSPNTAYYLKIKSTDANGNVAQDCNVSTTDIEAVSNTGCPTLVVSDLSFRTEVAPPVGGGGGGKPDFTAPTISNVKISNITENSATIAWDTDEKSSSLVQYGKSENLLSSTGGQIDSELEHKVVIKGLEPGTKYFLRANSIDWAGNIGVSEVKSFTTEKSLTIEEEISKLSTAEVQEKTKEVLKDLEEQIKAQKEDIVDPLQVLLDTLSPLIPEPIIIGESPTIEVAATSAAISWRTDKKSTSFVALSREDQFDSASQEPYKLIVGNPEDSTKEHKVEITGLLPATKYHYQVRSKALLGNTSESKDFTFTTKSELPQIVSFLQKKAENDKTAVIYWETSIPTDSVVKYTPYIKGKLSPKDAKLQGKPDMIADHEITLTNLDPGTVYQIEISGKDPFGNAVSKTLPDFTTAIDKDAPVISQVRIESAMISGKTPKIQTIISYRTDEPATSQIYFAEGGSDKFKQMTPDLNLSTIHTSVITDFKPASIYRIRIESTDESGNTATSRDFTILTPAQSESIIDIIIKTFENTFGWVKNIRF